MLFLICGESKKSVEQKKVKRDWSLPTGKALLKGSFAVRPLLLKTTSLCNVAMNVYTFSLPCSCWADVAYRKQLFDPKFSHPHTITVRVHQPR